MRNRIIRSIFAFLLISDSIIYLSCCSEHTWRRRRPTKVNKRSIFYSTNDSNEGHRRRLHSSKPNKGTSGSSSSSGNSTNKKSHHRRKRKRRTTRSKSRKRSSSAKLSPEKAIFNPHDENTPLSSPLDIQSISDDDDDDSVEIIGNQLAAMNCQNEQEQCDDSDSLDEALDAENCDDDEDSFISPDLTKNIA
jgi:hypothetical protein